jgi:hypothetical protein
MLPQASFRVARSRSSSPTGNEPRVGAEPSLVEDTTKTLRVRMGEDRFDHEQNRGTLLYQDEAVALARSVD